MIRIKLALDKTEYAALLQISENDLRAPADEIRHVLREELRRRGVALTGSGTATKSPVAPVDADVLAGGLGAPSDADNRPSQHRPDTSARHVAAAECGTGGRDRGTGQ